MDLLPCRRADDRLIFTSPDRRPLRRLLFAVALVATAYACAVGAAYLKAHYEPTDSNLAEVCRLTQPHLDVDDCIFGPVQPAEGE